MRREDATWYDNLYDGDAHRGYAVRSRMETVLRLAGRGSGEALDVGMGPGRLLFELDRLGWSVSGIDAAPEMVRLAQERLPHASSRMLCASAEDLPFEDGTFDLVTATGVLEYAGVSRAHDELRRVLRDAGRAVISYPTQSSLYGFWKTRVFYPSARSVKHLIGYEGRPQTSGAPLVSLARLCQLLAEAGLEPSEIVPTCYLVLPSPLDDLMPRTAEWLGRQFESRAFVPHRFATQVVIAARAIAEPQAIPHALATYVAVREAS